MKSFYIFRLFILTLVLFGWNIVVNAQSVSFPYTGAMQTYVVPSGITSVNVDMYGATGGNSSTGQRGGYGGRVQCVLAVTPGTTLYVYTGGSGRPGVISTSVAGGFNNATANGGWCSTITGYGGGGGGGSSDIRVGGTALSNRIIVAGAGGGGGCNCTDPGGNGGGLTGQNATACSDFAGTGGSQVCCAAGGTYSPYGTSGNGALGLGGVASTYPTNVPGSAGGGGGGGYYGGSGGSWGGGGGGSSYTDPTLATSVVHTQGFNTTANSDGRVTITAVPSGGKSFSYTGSVQYYTVPSGITNVTVQAGGASGGTGYGSYSQGGCGAAVVCSLTVVPGSVLDVYVGGVGTNGASCSGCTEAGGYNGGGNGIYYGAGGGGATDVRVAPYALSNRLVVAAGGGGGAYNYSTAGYDRGGQGGALTGEAGYSGNGNSPGVGGYGGTQSTFGAGGAYPGYAVGGSGSLGNGGTGVNTGGGGGGGYYGGGAGNWSGGGGGSSYTDPTLATAVVHTRGGNCGAGTVFIYPNCSAGPINGTPATCVGVTTALTDPTTGGTWTSSSPGVATVSSSGIVTGITAGTTTISYGGTFACGTVYTTQVVNVTAAPTSITGPSAICQTFTNSYSSIPGGYWTTNDPAIATVATSGDVTGVSGGTTTITYSINSACYTTRPVTVNPTAPITGPTAVCQTSNITLSDAITGGTWTSSNTSLATVDPSTGVVTGVSNGNPVISYTLPTGCTRTYGITVNPLPAVYSGNMFVCQGLNTTLTETSTGGTWSSSASAIAAVGPLTTTTGSVVGVAAGTASISYTLPTGCYLAIPFTVNPLPAAIIAPAAGVCVTNSDNAAITLSDATPSGTWTSGTTTVATIGSSTGSLTGLTTGTTVITYKLGTGCIATQQVLVNPSPALISGTPVVCQNAITYLNDASIGGVWSSSSTSMATIDAAIGIVTGVGAGTPVISYKLATGCLRTATITVNAAPAAISGNVPVCVGSNITLSDATPGANTWTSSNTGVASITSAGGVVTANSTGNPVITYTLGATGCFGTTTLTVNPTPAAITAARFDVCYGTTLTLNDASAGGAWSTASPAVTVIGGVVTPTASNTIPVTAVINYGYPGTGCNATQTVTIDPLPAVYALTAAKASYCANDLAGVDLTLLNSTAGTVRYSLYNGSTLEGSQDGTGSPLLFAGNTAAGTYYVVATDKTGIGCTATMTGTPTISIDPLPLSHHLSTAGSSTYCAGASGVDVTLDGSESTNNYFLKNTVSGYTLPAVAGIDAPLDFGVLPGDSTYIAYATSAAGCSNGMTGVVTINKNNLPDVHNVIVSDSGYYCAGGTGVHLGMDYSNSGVSYSLYKGGILVKKLAGSNAALDFGGNNLAGTYTVVAENALCAQNMNGSIPVAARPLPGTGYPVTPASAGYCAGGIGPEVMMTSSQPGNISYQLMLGATPVGVPLTAATVGGSVDFGAQTTGGTYTIVATDNTYVVTHCSATLTGQAVINAYPALHADTVTLSDNGQFCAGGTGVHVYLNSSVAGVYYQVFKVGGVAPILLGQTGTGGAIDFGMDTSAGAVTVLAMGSSGMGNCTAYMSGTPVVTVNTLPAANNVTVDNGGNYCAGGSGVSIGLAFSDAGVTYELYKNSVATGIQLAGANSSINFGKYTSEATYTVEATNNMTQCANNMTGSAIVKAMPAPVPYTLTGGGSYCTGGSGVAVGVFRSDAGVNYQLFYGGSPFGSAVPGTGSAIGFGIQTADGIYTVVGMDGTTGCTGNMTGSTVITIDPLPVAYDVTGGGSYCAGGAGLPVGLSNSVTGVNYQLLNSGVPVGAAMAGTTGSAINFGVKTAAGNYTVVANTAISGCTNSMTSSKVITVNALPAIDTVKGGGGYCAGDAGADIYMAHTRPGVNYMLYHGNAPVGTAVLGDGTNADLGLQGAAGSYNVIAADAATGCTSNMAGTVTVNINPLPFAYTITGGGTMCAGSTGYHIMLGGSQTGVRYNLYRSGVSTPVLLSGTDMALDFGEQATGGVYTVTAVNGATGCANNMTGSGTVTVNPAPASFAVMNGGHYCAGGAGVSVDLSGSETGINYQLYNGGAATGTPVGGTGTLISFGLQKAEGAEYTVRAVNTTSACGSDMTGSVAVVKDIPGTPAVSVVLSKPTACVGDAITYTALAVNGGSAPAYVWKVNSILAGIGDSYSNIPAEGDIVSVTMTSNANCITTARADNSVTMSLVPYVTPAAKVAVSPGTSVCHGTTVSLKATTVYGGDAPGYFWMRNGVFVASGTSYTYTPNSGNDQDVIAFMLRSNYACSTNDTVFSDPVVMTVDSAVVPVFALTSSFGPQADEQGVVGQIDTFTAVIDKSYTNWHYTYQWYVQGTPVPGATEPVYIDHTTYNNDVVSCEVTKTGACGSQPATKQIVAMLKNLGTQVVTAAGEVSVLPNPNKGDFTVKGTVGTGKDEGVTLEVTNMLGQRVYSSKVMARGGAINEHIKLGNALASGMYLLTLRSETATNVFHMVIEQ